MADLCIRSGATGLNTGLNWTDAFPTFPASLVRGNNYYIVPGTGTYGTVFLNDPEGISYIGIFKATVASHGPATGWNDAFEGQVVFDNIITHRGSYQIDGVSRDENNPNDPTAYGIRVIGAIVTHNDTFPPGGNNNIILFCDVGGAESDTYDAGIPNDAFDLVNISGASVTGWEIRGCRIHNARIGITLLAADGMVIEDCFFTNTFGKEAIIGLGRAKNIRVSDCQFYNTCQDDPDDPGSNGATADIAAWNSETPGDFDNWEIYGNRVWNDIDINHSDGVFLIGGNGTTWLGVGTTGTKVYNNTVAGIQSGVTNIQINGTGNFCYNNLGYDLAGVFSPNCDTEADNEVAVSDPFVNYATADFHLSASIPGTVLGAGYSDLDPDGVTRGTDGVWDIGAFQFEGDVPPDPPDPPLPTVACFTGLDRRDQYTAIYEALVDASGVEGLTTPECFRAKDQRDQITDFYAAVLALTQ